MTPQEAIHVPINMYGCLKMRQPRLMHILAEQAHSEANVWSGHRNVLQGTDKVGDLELLRKVAHRCQ